MKIYHKHNFAFGLFALLLGLLNLILDLLQGFTLNGAALAGLLLLLGGASLIRSLSLQWAQEDRLEERDERNRLVKLKSQSQAYRINQFLFLTAGNILCALGKLRNADSLLFLGLGLIAAFLIALLMDFFAWAYYDEPL